MSIRNPAQWHAGLTRGFIEFKQDFAPTRLLGQLFWPVVTLVAMFYFRDHHVSGVALGSVMYPSVLGMFTVFGLQLMAQYLTVDREDGTLLRARSTPHGVTAYLIGKSTLCTLTVLAYLLIVAIPGSFLVDGLAPMTVSRVMTLIWVVALGTAASQALGAVIGALVPSVRASGYVALVLMGLIAISGVFYPMASFPGWLQVIGQCSPIYWVGLGARSALLPDSAATAEITGTWRTWPTVIILLAWTAIGMAVAPKTLRAMSRKESGSRLSDRQNKAQQRAI